MIFGALLVAISYPITGSWKWGGGWLDSLWLLRFCRVYPGACCGRIRRTRLRPVAGCPRPGNIDNGKVNLIPGHNIPLATVGIFLLWFGWFGFNGGSVLSADPTAISFVFVKYSSGCCRWCSGCDGSHLCDHA